MKSLIAVLVLLTTTSSAFASSGAQYSCYDKEAPNRMRASFIITGPGEALVTIQVPGGRQYSGDCQEPAALDGPSVYGTPWFNCEISRGPEAGYKIDFYSKESEPSISVVTAWTKAGEKALVLPSCRLVLPSYR